VGFLPLIEVGEADALQISNGQVISVAGIDQRAKQAIPQEGGRKEVPQGVPQVGRKEERKKGEVVRVVAREGGGLVAVGEIYQGARGLVLKPLRVFRDAVFTKRPPYGKNTMPTMVNQGGR
jgi:hypothetical protein